MSRYAHMDMDSSALGKKMYGGHRQVFLGSSIIIARVNHRFFGAKPFHLQVSSVMDITILNKKLRSGDVLAYTPTE
jgi:hypothetical protein